jgi:exopolysaccharide production protein ExoZ
MKLRLDKIQELRGVSVLLVMIAHYPIFLSDFFCGAIGVDVFFVISGFIISYTWDVNKSSGSFLLKRIIRIYPVYVFLTILIFIGYLHFFPEYFKINSIYIFLASFIFQYDFFAQYSEPIIFAGWSLKYEMFFYILFAILYNQRTVLKLCLLILGFTGLFLNFKNAYIDFMFSPFYLYFLGGILIEENHAIFRIKGDKLLIFFSVLFLFVMLGKDQGYDFIGMAKEYIIFFGYKVPRFLIWGGPSMMLVLLYLKSSISDSLLRKGLLWLGNISYSLYLVHAAIRPFILSNRCSDITGLEIHELSYLGILLSLLLSYPIHLFVEKRLSDALYRYYI